MQRYKLQFYLVIGRTYFLPTIARINTQEAAIKFLQQHAYLIE